MFCNQCEQAARGIGCSTVGVCGKQPEVSALQDLLIHVLIELSQAADNARKTTSVPAQVNQFTAAALFSTLTNVQFDAERIVSLIRQATAFRDKLLAVHPDGVGKSIYRPSPTLEALVHDGESRGLRHHDPDILSLKQTVLYGLKGMAAYMDHAALLGHEDDTVYAFLHTALAALADTDGAIAEWFSLALRCGEMNLRVMELLDHANTSAYGHPVPTQVPLGHQKGKAILVSGHDLKDLANLLEQTQSMGISVYTHGEMLPCHGYPKLKSYPHFYGHYGTAWQNQQKEFAAFPGSILMTTNCIQKPTEPYASNIFTTGLVGWPGVTHVQSDDFTPVIRQAMQLPGFDRDEDRGSVQVGFARNTVLGVADVIIDAVKTGRIRHFFLVGGCDGAKPGRNYYSDFVEQAPEDTIILTLACGKFRFFDKKLGEIQGIPRLLDIGQCNDAYSAIQIALALSKAFNREVNELPLSLILSWYEQKAIAILLTLLYLGVKGIRIGPSLPAFITPGVLKALSEQFDVKPITTPQEDLQAILG